MRTSMKLLTVLADGGVAAPGAPTITAPSADATASSLTPTISWNRSADDPADGSVVYTVTLTLNAANVALTSASNLNATSYVINPTVLGYLAISDNAYTVTVTPSRSGLTGAAATRNFYVTPASVSGLRAWLDSTYGLFQDNLGTTPATADGDAVGYWTDRSGNTYHATQATGTAKPTLKLNIQNGQPVLRFDGGDSLAFPNDNLLDLPITVFLALKVNGASGFRYYLARQNAATNGGVAFYADTANHAMQVIDAASAYPTVVRTNAANAFDVLIAQAAEGDKAYMGRNTTSLTASTDTITSFSNAVAFNATIGRMPTSAANFLDGDYGLILIYDSKLGATNLSAVAAYVGTKYGVTIS